MLTSLHNLSAVHQPSIISTKPARHPVATLEHPPKGNFDNRSRRNLELVDNSDVGTRVFFRRRSLASVREGQGRGRSKQVLPAQVPNLGTNVYVRGTRLTHSNDPRHWTYTLYSRI